MAGADRSRLAKGDLEVGAPYSIAPGRGSVRVHLSPFRGLSRLISHVWLTARKGKGTPSVSPHSPA